MYPEDRERIANSLESYLKGETDYWKIEHRLLTESGNYKWVLVQGKVVEQDGEGKPLRITGTMTDINRIKLFEKSLREYEKTIESLEEMVAVMDKKKIMVIKILLSQIPRWRWNNSLSQALSFPLIDRNTS